MSENWSRWQARIGSLKSYAVGVGLISMFLLWILIDKLQVALHNPSEPQRVQISQLVREEISKDQYISVAGTAYYPISYIENENDQQVASFYALIDASTGDVIFVRTTQPLPDIEQESVTVTGISHVMPLELQSVIQSDLQEMHEAGLSTTPNLYLEGGQKPGNVSLLILGIAGLGLLLILCVAVLFFPNTVFRSQPVDASAVPATGVSVAKATGRFQKLKRLEPSIELGRGTHRFREANANLAPLGAQRLMVYIHYVESFKGVGITLFRNKTDWAAFVDPSHTLDVEPGKLLGWRDRWAVRLRYKNDQGKSQALILTFDDTGPQFGFLNALQQMGFPVGTGKLVPA